jgi:hypothetical protein
MIELTFSILAADFAHISYDYRNEKETLQTCALPSPN